MKEFFRKRLVGLKRSPQIIPILLTLVCCCIYTFSSAYSSASQALYQEHYIKQIQGIFTDFKVPALYRNPALYMFVQTLFSILLPITFLSIYKRGKRNNFMFSVALILIAVMIACDLLYYLSINFYTSELPGSFNLALTEERQSAMTNSIVHLVFLAITLVVTLLLPLIKAGLNKINTSVEDEYDKLMEQKTEEELMIELENE